MGREMLIKSSDKKDEILLESKERKLLYPKVRSIENNEQQ